MNKAEICKKDLLLVMWEFVLCSPERDSETKEMRMNVIQ